MTSWHFEGVTFELFCRKWWKPYVFKFHVKPHEEAAWLDYYGHIAVWEFNWLGFNFQWEKY